MYKLTISFLIIVTIGAFAPLKSQLYTSGQFDMVLRNYSAKDYTSKTFYSFSNYDIIRFRLFFDAKPSDNLAVFTQFLLNNDQLQLYGAYARYSFSEVDIHIHVGLIPNTVGIWGPRTYSDKNPFIAIPLMYVYKSSLNTRNLTGNPDDLIHARANNLKIGGSPILYDACWNTGLELFGTTGSFSWSVAAITGSVTKPTIQPKKDMPQFTGRIGFSPLPEFQLSLSGFWGTYLTEDVQEQFGDSLFNINNYVNTGAGLSIYYTKDYFEFQSEVFWARWEHPFIGDLDAWSAYAEAEYKFAIQWYAAMRLEFIRYSEISGTAGTASWDVPVNRYAIVLGHKLNRNTKIKLDTQLTRSSAGEFYDDNIIALQLAVNL